MIDIRVGLCYGIKCSHYIIIALHLLCIQAWPSYVSSTRTTVIPAHEEEDEGDDAEDADDDGDTNEDRGSPEGRGENGSEVVQATSADISSILAEI